MKKISDRKYLLWRYVAAHPLYFSVDEKKQVLKTSGYNPPEFICEVVQLRWSCWDRLKIQRNLV